MATLEIINRDPDIEPPDLGDFYYPDTVADPVFYRLTPTRHFAEKSRYPNDKDGPETGRILAGAKAMRVYKELIVADNGALSKGSDAEHGTFFTYDEIRVSNLDDVQALISPAGNSYIVTGALKPGRVETSPVFGSERVIRRKEAFVDTARKVIIFDVDGIKTPSLAPAKAALFIRDNCLPEEFRGVACAYHATRSHGISEKSRLRMAFMIDRPTTLAKQADWSQRGPEEYREKIDGCTFTAAQPIFTSVKVKGLDPFPARSGQLGGAASASPPKDLKAKPARSYNRNKKARPGAVENSPHMIREFVDRTIRRDEKRFVDLKTRNAVIRGAGQDCGDTYVNPDLGVLIVQVWRGLDDDGDAHRDLVAQLTALGMKDAEQIADNLERAGLEVAHCFDENSDERVMDADLLEKYVRIGHDGRDNDLGSDWVEEEKPEDFAADDDEGMARSDAAAEAATDATAAFAAWRPDMGSTAKTKALAAALYPGDVMRQRGLEATAVSAVFMNGVDDSDLKEIEAEVEKLTAPAQAETIAQPYLPAPVFIAYPDKLPPRAFVYSHDYVRKFVTMTTSPGGRGKSSLLLAEAVGMATGRALDGKPTKKFRVLHWSLEDPKDELLLRLGAIQKRLGLTPDAFGDNLFVMSARQHPIKIAKMEKGSAVVNKKDADRLIATIRDLRLDIVQLDPLVSLHNCGENDTMAQDLVIKTLGRIADETNSAIHIANHARKPQRDADGQITSFDSRGAGSTIDAVRGQRLLNPMTVKEAGSFGVQELDRWRYLKLEDGKGNLRPKQAAAWLKLESQLLENGTDEYEASNIQVVVNWTAPQVNAVQPVKDAGWDAREALAQRLASTPGVFQPLKKIAEEMKFWGLTDAAHLARDFKKIVMGDAVEKPTALGRLTWTKTTKDGLQVMLQVGQSGDFARADEEAGDDA